MLSRRWDIFCQLVDNFGDIGVCWRLAKQLQHTHGFSVQLYVDNLNAAKHVIPEIDDKTSVQVIDGITLIHWQQEMDFEQTADVVIEAFACGLPDAYLARLATNLAWVNLEYLSAETWVEDFHGKHSVFSRTNLTRHFYFPGFQSNTGGLLRERGIIEKRDTFLSGDQRNSFLQRFDIADDDRLKVSLFSYQNAPLDRLFDAMSNGKQEVTVFAPLNPHLQTAAQFFNQEKLTVGDSLVNGKLHLQVLPFMSQEAYDCLLWYCDINFVRGEDSWVRAVWAGKPFIWQPYVQTENTHLIKLKAFLDYFYQEFDEADVIENLSNAWSSADVSREVWQHYMHAYISALPVIKAWHIKQTKQLAIQDDLATRLVAFCESVRS